MQGYLLTCCQMENDRNVKIKLQLRLVFLGLFEKKKTKVKGSRWSEDLYLLKGIKLFLKNCDETSCVNFQTHLLSHLPQDLHKNKPSWY